jgi:hypothetical protein
LASPSSNGNGADPRANGHSPGRVSYAEVRRTARWLRVFAPSDLAGALRADLSVGERFVKALVWQGICRDTGDRVDGPDGPEPVYEMEPLPERVYPRARGMRPEIKAVIDTGGFLLFNQRGMPVRTSSSDERRKMLSQPGVGKRIRDRERARKRLEEAIEKRRQLDRARRRARDEHRSVEELL